MLKQLRLTNVILVESATIDFGNGLNVLSGETGSGKSAIIGALSLLQGERASSDLIRQKATQATIEALFDIDKVLGVLPLLQEAGIEHDPNEYLIIRRELHSNGKSRAFINNQMAQLSTLQRVGKLLVDSIGQHANQKLLSLDAQRTLLDAFGDLNLDREAFQQALENETKIRKELDEMVTSEAKRLREIEICRMEIEELGAASLKEGEEEELFAEYTVLVNREELTTSVNQIIEGLTTEGRGVLGQLSRLNHVVEKLGRIDSSLQETLQSFKSGWMELQEVSYSLSRYNSGLDANPYRLEAVNERLTMISKLKRKYGSSVEEIQSYLQKREEKLAILENADERIDALKILLDESGQKTNGLAAKLSKGRQKAAKSFSTQLLKVLRTLNMPHAEFEVKVVPQKRMLSGDDHVEFYLAPNPGEGLSPLRDCASGGELSRVMLATKAVVAGKEGTPTLIFDEIDANIGGETASVVGETLADIATRHQVLCITHFPQVAHKADYHLKIAKEQKGGRTVTTIAVLDPKERHEELSRMMGGEKFSAALSH